MPTIVAHVGRSRALPRAFASWAIPPFLGPAVRHLSLLRPRPCVGAESPRAVPTFLLPVLRSRSAALSAGLDMGASPVGSRSAGPQSLSRFGPAVSGDFRRSTVPPPPVGHDDGSLVRSSPPRPRGARSPLGPPARSCSAPRSVPAGSGRSPVFAPLHGSDASLYRGGDAVRRCTAAVGYLTPRRAASCRGSRATSFPLARHPS